MTTNAFGLKTRTISIDIWSDIMCPFCYIGDTLLTQALENFEHRDAVTLQYHSYQLMPDLAHDHAVDIADVLAGRRGFSRAQAVSMNEGVAERGREVGLEFNFDQVQTINTRTAHRLIQHAGLVGGQHEVVQRLFKAYFADGLNVADHETLANIATDVGLEHQGVLAALNSAELDQRIDADIAQAAAMGISGVPFFVLDGRYGVSGAQPLATFTQVLQQVWDEQKSH